MRNTLLSAIMIPTAMLLSSCGNGEPAQPQLSDEERLAMAPSVKNGERQFLQCAVCHDRVEGTGHRVGPNLWGIVGAPAARHEDFTYSKALERSGLVWDTATLDAYIQDPKEVVPGGRMAYAGLDNEADRRDLVAYLETLK
ncbi:cytochrome c family protein [Parvularcula flava]|nr:cytochrome c family protein [Aquisalinus luteolus]NHK27729.1 cytochrome c family protein [Aquisalinus luteolus]